MSSQSCRACVLVCSLRSACASEFRLEFNRRHTVFVVYDVEAIPQVQSSSEHIFAVVLGVVEQGHTRAKFGVTRKRL